jgi:aconitate hydratase
MYALMGNVAFDYATTPLGQGKDGKDIFIKDLWFDT